MHRQQRQWCEEQEKTDTEHKLELREGWAVTKADPEGSEEALKADSQSRDEGGSVWKQRRWNTIWGQGPPAASPLCSGPVSASASEVLNNPPAHTHTHTHTLQHQALHPPAIWWLNTAPHRRIRQTSDSAVVPPLTVCLNSFRAAQNVTTDSPVDYFLDQSSPIDQIWSMKQQKTERGAGCSFPKLRATGSNFLTYGGKDKACDQSNTDNYPHNKHGRTNARFMCLLENVL